MSSHFLQNAASRGGKSQMPNAVAPSSSASGMSSSASANSTKQHTHSHQRLPRSAPVSSFLPPIPANSTHQQQHHPQHHLAAMADSTAASQLRAQYAMLLQPGAAALAASSTSFNNPFVSFGVATHRAHEHHHPALHLSAAATVRSDTAAPPPQYTNPIVPVPAASAAQLMGHSALGAFVKPPPSPPPPISMPGMQNWSVQQLSHRVAMLRQLNQPVPQSLMLLLSEATRRDERRKAKRMANRKSASTSRARKKAMVQQMTDLNARLRRQALILALLPDLVIVIDVDGVITFCSDQVERVLKYKPESLLGSKLTDLLVGSSRGRLINLIKKLAVPAKEEDIIAEATVHDDDDATKEEQKEVSGDDVSTEKQTSVEEAGAVLPSLPSGGASAAEVSDPSFPMSVVKVAASAAAAAENDNSDTSASRDSKQPSSLTNSASLSLTRSPTAESLGNSGSEDTQVQRLQPCITTDGEKKKASKQGKKGQLPSSDTSNTSSRSFMVDAEVKKLSKANANLERNVRYHNTKLKKRSLGSGAGFKDDVTGAAVTANNADARLSSLWVMPVGTREPPSSEDDSGYRESNDSREETSSSSASDGDTSESNGRRKPLAPTCNVCLIRDDMTTVWCEVTSSVRTRHPDEGRPDMTMDVAGKSNAGSSSTGSQDDTPEPPKPRETVRELLLCLRPIRDGEEKVDAKHRFASSPAKQVSDSTGSNTNPSTGTEEGTTSSSTTDHQGHTAKAPIKKRKAPAEQLLSAVGDAAKKRSRVQEGAAPKLGIMDNAVESLVNMSSNK